MSARASSNLPQPAFNQPRPLGLLGFRYGGDREEEDPGLSCFNLTEAAPHYVHHTVYIIACVAWRFWLGELSDKGGRGQRNREEIGAGAT